MIKYFFFLFLIIGKSNAQITKVLYEFSQNKTNPFGGMVHTEEMILTSEKSVSIRINSKTIRNFEASTITEKNGIITERISDNHTRVIDKNRKFEYFKDYLIDSLFSSQAIGKNEYVIGEKVSQFVWSIVEKDTIYLEQTCKIAVAKHRGHTWTAFFSDRFATQGGPWKLDGLPGLILYAVTEDDNYEFKAIRIETANSSEVVQNPFLHKATITWGKISALKQDYFKKRIAYMKSKDESPDGSESVTVKMDSAIESYGFEEVK